MANLTLALVPGHQDEDNNDNNTAVLIQFFPHTGDCPKSLAWNQVTTPWRKRDCYPHFTSEETGTHKLGTSSRVIQTLSDTQDLSPQSCPHRRLFGNAILLGPSDVIFCLGSHGLQQRMNYLCQVHHELALSHSNLAWSCQSTTSLLFISRGLQGRFPKSLLWKASRELPVSTPEADFPRWATI